MDLPYLAHQLPFGRSEDKHSCTGGVDPGLTDGRTRGISASSTRNLSASSGESGSGEVGGTGPDADNSTWESRHVGPFAAAWGLAAQVAVRLEV